MTRLELLAKQLDAEATPYDMQATQKIFTEGLEFWSLCMEAKRLLLEQRDIEKEANQPEPRDNEFAFKRKPSI